MTDCTVWPTGFSDIGEKTFAWVREHRPDWVDFTLTEMKNPSGLFLEWKTYLLDKEVKENAKNQKVDAGAHD